MCCIYQGSQSGFIYVSYIWGREVCHKYLIQMWYKYCLQPSNNLYLLYQSICIYWTSVTIPVSISSRTYCLFFRPGLTTRQLLFICLRLLNSQIKYSPPFDWCIFNTARFCSSNKTIETHHLFDTNSQTI